MIFDMWVSDSVFVCPTCWLTWITVVTLCWLRNLSSQWVRQNMFIHLEEMEKPWQIIALHWSSLIHESYYYFWLLHTGSRLVEWQPLVSGQAGLLSRLETCYCLDLGTYFSALEQPAPKFASADSPPLSSPICSSNTTQTLFVLMVFSHMLVWSADMNWKEKKVHCTIFAAGPLHGQLLNHWQSVMFPWWQACGTPFLLESREMKPKTHTHTHTKVGVWLVALVTFSWIMSLHNIPT